MLLDIEQGGSVWDVTSVKSFWANVHRWHSISIINSRWDHVRRPQCQPMISPSISVPHPQECPQLQPANISRTFIWINEWPVILTRRKIWGSSTIACLYWNLIDRTWSDASRLFLDRRWCSSSYRLVVEKRRFDVIEYLLWIKISCLYHKESSPRRWTTLCQINLQDVKSVFLYQMRSQNGSFYSVCNTKQDEVSISIRI